MLSLAIKTILRRPLRSGLTMAGVALAVAVLTLIEQTGSAYKSELSNELNRMGIQLMLVPLGCPYDAAARILKDDSLENSLPEEAVIVARKDPAVEIAAPIFLVAVPRPEQGRTDMFVGLDDSGIGLRRWWQAAQGNARFATSNQVILGADAAIVEMRTAGDFLYSPETRERFQVGGILKHSGTSDDSRFFLSLETAQRIFKSPHRVTAVAIRLRDPAEVQATSERLRDIPGVQVVTATEMMGTFLRILAAVKTLLGSVALVALCASVLGLANTLLMSVAERSFEFSLFRAIGASRAQIFLLIGSEALALTLAGVFAGLLLTIILGPLLEHILLRFLPFPTLGKFNLVGPVAALNAIWMGVAVAILVSFFPAWRALSNEPASVLKGAE